MQLTIAHGDVPTRQRAGAFEDQGIVVAIDVAVTDANIFAAIKVNAIIGEIAVVENIDTINQHVVTANGAEHPAASLAQAHIAHGDLGAGNKLQVLWVTFGTNDCRRFVGYNRRDHQCSRYQ